LFFVGKANDTSQNKFKLGESKMIYARQITAYRSSDSNIVIELPGESIDLPFTLERRDDMDWATLNESVLDALFSRDDVSLSPDERGDLELYFTQVAEQIDS